MSPNRCPKCLGDGVIKVVDIHDGYRFIDAPCKPCGGTGYVQEVPIAQGMYLCSSCGKKKYDFTYHGLMCRTCDIEKITEANYKKWRKVK